MLYLMFYTCRFNQLEEINFSNDNEDYHAVVNYHFPATLSLPTSAN